MGMWGKKVLWAHQDSNLEPTHYECGALTVELWAPNRVTKLRLLNDYFITLIIKKLNSYLHKLAKYL